MVINISRQEKIKQSVYSAFLKKQNNMKDNKFLKKIKLLAKQDISNDPASKEEFIAKVAIEVSKVMIGERYTSKDLYSEGYNDRISEEENEFEKLMIALSEELKK